MPLAAAIAFTATAGSLWMSEVAGYVPCALCWYQRIAMYPLTVVAGVAAWRRDGQAWLTVLPIAAIGAIVSIYHLLIERVPGLAGPCDPAAPCTIRWVEEFGFLTLPGMALTGFVAISLLALAARTPAVDHLADDAHRDDPDRDDPDRDVADRDVADR
ncbi:disulfide bond formation protein B [Nitriliruptoraceae bacterium ZYF776]|nr:disulfide bond formation protein B [Profundirhabdus halotolerans]